MRRFILAAALLVASIASAVALTPQQALLLFGQSTGPHDGISLNFATNTFVLKVPGQAARYGAFTDIFAFTRNTPAASYRAQSGLIAYANENQLQQSQTFDNAYWPKVNVSVVADQAVAPDGTLTADLLREDSSVSALHQLSKIGIVVTGLNSGLSVYAKAAGRTWIELQVGSSGTSYFNLSSCAVGTVAGGYTAVATPAGNGWCRVSISGATIANGNSLIFLATGDGVNTYTGDGTSGVYLWGAQGQQGDVVGAYLPTTGAAKYDQPRIQYDATGNATGLMSEETRTNIILQSEDRTTTWSIANVTHSANTTVAPDGATTADSIVLSGGNIVHASFQGVAKAASALVYTGSTFLKSGTGITQNRMYVCGDLTTTNCGQIDINIATCAVSNATTSGAGFTSASGTATTYANGWCRATLTVRSDTATTIMLANYAFNGVSTTINSDGSFWYAWGSQLEQAETALSYIPTTTASRTRNQDIPLLTNNAVWNVNSGTIVATVYQPQISAGGQYNVMDKNDSGGSDGYALYRVTTAWISRNTGADVITLAGLTTPGFMKAAASWGPAGHSITHSGLTPTTSSSTSPVGDPAASIILGAGTTGGANALNGDILKLDLWMIQMPNSFLQFKTLPGTMSWLEPANDNEIRKLA